MNQAGPFGLLGALRFTGGDGEAPTLTTLGARDAGKLRLEGKEYVVKDGDMLHFRFAN